MMMSIGHEVYLYAGPENDADCTEHIVCTDPTGVLPKDFSATGKEFSEMNAMAINHIGHRIESKDFICLIGGLAQKPIADAFPAHMNVEFGVGYGGVFSQFKVFESYAWMHTVYGHMGACQGKTLHDIDGNFYDAVIPNYFEVDDFPFSEEKEDYYLYIGRLTDRKGFQIAADVCKYLGKCLIVAGEGDAAPPTYGEYVGPVGPEERGRLMSKAIATFVPTLYLEPFGGVAIESMLCGTPCITTDWGAFSETIENGFNGYRCRTFGEFVAAAEAVKGLSCHHIREDAIRKYSTEVVKHQYHMYFEQLMTLYGDGFYDLHSGRIPISLGSK